MAIGVVLFIAGCASIPAYPDVDVEGGQSDGVGEVEVTKEAVAVSPDMVANIDRSSTDFGIYPGVVEIGNIGIGGIADTWLHDDVNGLYKAGDPTGVLVFNNLEWEASFEVEIRPPARFDEPYVAIPDYALRDWVVLYDANPVLKPMEIRLVPVAVMVPKDAEYPESLKFEFRVTVRQAYEGQSYVVANSSRWLVSMK